MHNPITILKIKEVTLTVIYDKSYCGLHNYFSSDDRMCQFLKSNTDEAYLHSINKVDVDSYLLNIASIVPPHVYCPISIMHLHILSCMGVLSASAYASLHMQGLFPRYPFSFSSPP